MSGSFAKPQVRKPSLPHGLVEAWERSLQVDEQVIDAFDSLSSDSPFLLLATGGYGRQELFPYSDLDVLLLIPNEDLVPDGLDRVISSLWDRGFQVNHALRTRVSNSEVMEKDVRTLSSLLDSRLLLGSKDEFNSYVQDVGNVIEKIGKDDFLKLKWAERTRRLHRFGNTYRVQEPDLKSGRGGLRDYLFLLWIGRTLRGFEVDPHQALRELLGKKREKTFHDVLGWICALRTLLHHENKRCMDRVLLSDQEKLAKTLGYRSGKGLRASERFMSALYSNMALIAETLEEKFLKSGRVLSSKKRRKKLDILEILEKVDPQAPEIERRYDSRERLSLLPLVLELREQVLVGISAGQKKKIRKYLWEKLEDANVAPSLLRVADQSGLLSKVLPVWKSIRHRVQHNFLHAYTLDEHLLRTVSEASKYIKEEPEHLHARTLLLAALLHDIGKGGQEDHSKRGERLARGILEDWGAEPKEVRDVCFLVRNHLIHSHTAQRRDLGDPDVIRSYLRKVNSVERVNHLHYLTMADMEATGPHVLNAWKKNLLGELRRVSISRLELGSSSLPSTVLMRREISKKLSEGHPKPLRDKNWSDYLKKYSRSYLHYTSPETILQDERLVSEVREGSLISMRFDSWEGELGQLTIVAKDQTGIFALLTRILARKNWNIHSAEIFSPNDDWIIDRFVVSKPRNLEHRLRGLRKELERSLESFLLTGEMGEYPRSAMPKKHVEVPTKVVYDAKASRKQGVFEVYGPDELGLLARLSEVFLNSRLLVHQAKISTEGARVADYFFVTLRNGRKPKSAGKIQKVKRDLAKVFEKKKVS